jgi:hypothetical protein
VCDRLDASDRSYSVEALMTSTNDGATAMSKQTEHDFWQHQHGRKAGSGRAPFAPSKYPNINWFALHRMALLTAHSRLLYLTMQYGMSNYWRCGGLITYNPQCSRHGGDSVQQGLSVASTSRILFCVPERRINAIRLNAFQSNNFSILKVLYGMGARQLSA